MAIRRYISGEHVSIKTGDGEDLGACLTSCTYNAAIGAVELRAPRTEGEEQTIPCLASPLYVTIMGRVACLIHFEAETRIPFELDVTRVTITKRGDDDRVIGRDCLVTELVVLRGARIEVV